MYFFVVFVWILLIEERKREKRRLYWEWKKCFEVVLLLESDDEKINSYNIKRCRELGKKRFKMYCDKKKELMLVDGNEKINNGVDNNIESDVYNDESMCKLIIRCREMGKERVKRYCDKKRRLMVVYGDENNNNKIDNDIGNFKNDDYDDVNEFIRRCREMGKKRVKKYCDKKSGLLGFWCDNSVLLKNDDEDKRKVRIELDWKRK